MTGGLRVVVTGLGTVNAVGAGGLDDLARMLADRASGIRAVTAFPLGEVPSRLAAAVDPATLDAHIDRDAARRLSRVCQLAVAAARLAVDDSGLEGGPGLGVVVGTELGDFRSSEEFFAGYLRRGVGGLSPMIFPNTVMNAMGAQVAIAVGAQGPTVTVNQATVAGDLSVARAVALIRSGRARAMLAGGVDEICGPVYRHMALMGLLSPMGGPGPEGCRPFSADHNGLVLGEGATFLALEEAGAAAARGARVRAELLGAGWSAIPVAPHTAPAHRRCPSSFSALLGGLDLAAVAFGACFGSGNGDPALDDWETALLSADLESDLGPAAGPRAPTGPGVAHRLCPPRSLAPLFGQHGGLGVLRAGAAGLAAAAGPGGALAHGLARGGARVALAFGPPP